MKRIITLLLILLLSFSVVSCKSKQDDENAKAAAELQAQTDDETEEKDKWSFDYEGVIAVDSMPYEINNLDDLVEEYPISMDCFVGKVISAEVILPKAPIYTIHRVVDDCSGCNGFFRLDKFSDSLFYVHSDIYVYTVEIEQVVNSIFTTEKTTIQIISDIDRQDAPLEEGNRYLLGGFLFQYGEKTMLRHWFRMSAKVDSEGRLEGVGADAEIINSLGTVQNFAQNEKIKKLFEKETYFSGKYADDYELDEYCRINVLEKDANTERFIADAKKALIVGSGFKMDAKTAIIDWPNGLSAEQYVEHYEKKYLTK